MDHDDRYEQVNSFTIHKIEQVDSLPFMIEYSAIGSYGSDICGRTRMYMDYKKLSPNASKIVHSEYIENFLSDKYEIIGDTIKQLYNDAACAKYDRVHICFEKLILPKICIVEDHFGKRDIIINIEFAKKKGFCETYGIVLSED